MIFRKYWNVPAYSRECLLYRFHCHLFVETRSSTIGKPNIASRYYRWLMWRHVGPLHSCCLSASTDYGNSHASGYNIEDTLNTGHLSQLKMSGPLWSMSWQYWGHFNIGPFGCRRGIQSHCIVSSLCKMSCSIIWTAWCNRCLWKRLHGRKTCSLVWSQLERSCPNTTLESPRRRACVLSPHISSIRFLKFRSFSKWEKGMDINPEHKISYTTKYQEAILNYVEK